MMITEFNYYISLHLTLQSVKKTKVFWDIIPWSLEVDQCFRGAYCLHHQGDGIMALMMEAVCTSETPVYSETILRYIPECYHLHTCRHENLNSLQRVFSLCSSLLLGLWLTTILNSFSNLCLSLSEYKLIMRGLRNYGKLRIFAKLMDILLQ
jgi:hypothetical protein